MSESDSKVTRRRFLQTTIAAAGASTLPFDRLAAAALPFGRMGAAVHNAAKYTRFNVMSAGGQKALASYAKGVEAMLKLPATDGRNWFRNAFIHLMDCPHGNWWFYVWHRGYLGYFEQTIRTLSGDPTFAMPYWDWTILPQIPDRMFDGVLAPSDVAYAPTMATLDLFTSSLKPALMKYWSGLTPAQVTQLNSRGYTAFDKMWNDVTGNGDVGNRAYAPPGTARYLTRANPKLDKNTTRDVSPEIVKAGLELPEEFYTEMLAISFTSSKTLAHGIPPARHSFSILEGLPHNKTHNLIGGVGPLNPGPYGLMTNNLSPIDPLFFLHHSNMDRLWDVWVRKQKGLKLPYLPTGKDLDLLSNEPFLFYVNAKGEAVGTSHAGEYFNTDRFEYDYEPGFGEEVVRPAKALLAGRPMSPVRGTVKGSTASLALPTDAIRSHLNPNIASTLVAQVTLPHPSATSPEREFDVFVGAPTSVTPVGADSPYYVGTIAFLGSMSNMKGMSAEATFVVPLPKTAQVFHSLGALKSTPVEIRVVSSHDQRQTAPPFKVVVVRTR